MNLNFPKRANLLHPCQLSKHSYYMRNWSHKQLLHGNANLVEVAWDEKWSVKNFFKTYTFKADLLGQFYHTSKQTHPETTSQIYWDCQKNVYWLNYWEPKCNVIILYYILGFRGSVSDTMVNFHVQSSNIASHWIQFI